MQKYLKRQTNGSISYVKESLRECDWQFGVYHNSSTMTFSLERSFFSYVISNRSRSILIGSSIFMPLSRSHMVGISKAFKLLGNYCDELPKLFSFFQLANFTVDIFWLQREFYRQIKTMCPSYFIYLFCFRFFLLSLDWYCIIKKCLHMWCMWLQMIFHFSSVHMSRSNKYAALVECTQSFDRIYRACSNQHFTIVLQHVSFSLPHFVFFDFVYSCCRFHSQCYISHAPISYQNHAPYQR